MRHFLILFLMSVVWIASQELMYGRNYYGESFRIAGFYSTGNEGVSGMLVGPLEQTLTIPSTLTTEAPEFVPLPGGLGGGMFNIGGSTVISSEILEQLRLSRPEVSVGLENNMINQGIMLERFHLRYEIITEEGERFSGFIPDKDFYISRYLPPAHAYQASEEAGIRTQLGGQEENRTLIPVLLVETSTIRFMLDHLNELPAFPFQMLVFVKAFGRADNRKIYETPEAVITIEWIA